MAKIIVQDRCQKSSGIMPAAAISTSGMAQPIRDLGSGDGVGCFPMSSRLGAANAQVKLRGLILSLGSRQLQPVDIME